MNRSDAHDLRGLPTYTSLARPIHLRLYSAGRRKLYKHGHHVRRAMILAGFAVIVAMDATGKVFVSW